MTIPTLRLSGARFFRVALALSLIASSGCLGGASDEPEAVLDDNAFEIRVTTFPGSTKLTWFLDVKDNTSKGLFNGSIALSVEKRGGVPAGDERAEISVEPGSTSRVRFQTPFLGYGDYFYVIALHDNAGKLLARKEGMHEACASALRSMCLA